MMEIKRIKDARFGSHKLYRKATGWCFYVAGKGYVAFSDSRDKYGILTPYIPAGGKETLKDILLQGGFTSFEGIEFVNEL